MRKKALLLSHLFLFFLSPFVSKAQALNTQDSLALVDLYNSTNGPGWVDHTNWLTSAPVANWKGVQVGNGRVLALVLASNRLIGPLPSSLGNLTAITSISFSGNGLTGSIPSTLSNLTMLNSLDLSQNQFTGSIPPSFNNFVPSGSYFYYFNFAQNQLSGIIPAFTNFSTSSSTSWGFGITLDNNKFNFSSFEVAYLTVHDANITDSPQSSLPLITSGNTLSVAAGGVVSANTYSWYKDGNFVTSIIGDSTYTPATSGNYTVAITSSLLPHLTLFSTSYITSVQDSLSLVDLYNNTGGPQWTNHTNWLSTAPLSTWYGVTAPNGRVTQLTLSGNNLTGVLSSSIGNLSALVDLELDNNSLSGSLPSTLGNLSLLNYLHIC
jgi:Leucine-rich repeat (LRR) protein